MNGDQVLAAYEQVHLAQRVGISALMAPGAIEDEENVVVVVVELGALAEVLDVLERERMKSEDLAQLRKLFVPGRGEIEPEEMVAVEMVANVRFIDAVEARRDELKLIAYRIEDH